jgi:hypothetical protein
MPANPRSHIELLSNLTQGTIVLQRSRFDFGIGAANIDTIFCNNKMNRKFRINKACYVIWRFTLKRLYF